MDFTINRELFNSHEIIPRSSTSLKRRKLILSELANLSSLKQKPKKGFTFGYGNSNRTGVLSPLGGVPGPGYYFVKSDATRPKAVCFSIPISSESCAKRRLLAKSLDMSSAKLESSFGGGSGYQRFAQSNRFAEKKSYSRILDRHKVNNNDIVLRNKDSISLFKHEIKLDRIVTNSRLLNTKIESANRLKGKLEEEEKTKFIQRSQSIAKRLSFRREILQHYTTVYNWIHIATTLGMLKRCANVYLLKREVKVHCEKYWRMFFTLSRVVGRFRKVLAGIRLHKAKVKLRSIVAIKKNFWSLKRRIRSKKHIAKFFDRYSEMQVKCLLIMTVGSAILRVQKWYRRYMVKKRLMLALMNVMWSAIEYLIAKGMIETREKGREKMPMVRKAILRRKKRDIVPLKVRIHFVKHQLQVLLH